MTIGIFKEWLVKYFFVHKIVLKASPVYVPEIETGRHVKNNACTVEIKIKWMIRKHMTYENIYRDEVINRRLNNSTMSRNWSKS